jgi:hypothetical protein
MVHVSMKLAACALLGVLWLIDSDSDQGLRLALLVFGIVNVLATFPGTKAVRIPAIVTACLALVAPDLIRVYLAIIAWLIWPPVFLLLWGLAGELSVDDPARQSASTRARLTVAATIGAVAIAALVHQWLVRHSLNQTAALFIGLPAFLAIAVVFTVSPRSATGVACKAVTIGLLASLLFFGEGFLCVAMSAPLFYGAAILIGQAVKQASQSNRSKRLLSNVAIMAFIPMSLEGVTDVTTLDRDAWVTETRIVEATPAAVERALRETPRFDRMLPTFLRAGFPRPTSTRVGDTAAGSTWVINFRGGEMRIDGQEPRDGDLVLKLEDARPGFMRWRAISDDSHMTHYMSWRESIVQWEAVDAAHTRVTWTIGYSRDLDPAWYFGPWERYAVRLAAGYLIDAVATP